MTSYCCAVAGLGCAVTSNAVHAWVGRMVVVSSPLLLVLISAPLNDSSALTSWNRVLSVVTCGWTVIVDGSPGWLRNST